ncbi:phosphate ABC transporter substrate-binding prot ein [Desulfonema ishimotonii]|uniref:Phosphate-binding protein n=1 Tax=Desulfonema ishimotonii TaxID=45657 RepID=A0A401FRN9_9BACT|nr:phosphate ABC transporter substrate-binding protein [Desulfonema ishimotonii]GBC59623.1 phosphate ABC transporter substrate-binding prot ein [Desulfonema ishimotonii]
MKKRTGFIGIVVALALVFGATAWAENIVMKGSTTVLPIAQEIAEAYMKAHPDVKISISGGGSGNGIKAIIDGTTDIGNSSRFIKGKEVKLAVEKGTYPVPFAVAYDCIIPVVHPGNPVTNLTLAQLRDIYMGKITNWKDLGGPDLKIVVISRDTSSGTYEVWEKKVMKKERVYPGALLQASNGAVVTGIAKNRNAIGYIGIGYLTKGVKALTVEGIEGTRETTLNGKFPVSRPLYMFTRGWPTGSVAKFINYIINPGQGQKYVEKSGYVPLF